MKSTRSLTTLSMLLIFGAVTGIAALPQQLPGPVPAEKKRAMNKFDPTDLFPEAKEHGRKKRTKWDKNSATPSILASNESSAGTEPPSATRKGSRRRRSEATRSTNSETRLATNTTPAPTPAVISASSAASASPSLAVQKTEPTPDAVMGGATALTTPPSQTLIASNNTTAPSSDASPRRVPQDSWLSLPVILTLLSLVTLALIVALAKLMKQVRKSVS